MAGKKPYRFSGVRPCAHCPFRNDIRPYLTVGRVVEITSSLLQDGSFPCHETTVDVEDEETGEGRRIATADSLQCAGAMIILEKIEQPNQIMRIMERIGAYDRTKMDMDAPVYDDFDEMIAATVRENDGRGYRRRQNPGSRD